MLCWHVLDIEPFEYCLVDVGDFSFRTDCKKSVHNELQWILAVIFKPDYVGTFNSRVFLLLSADLFLAMETHLTRLLARETCSTIWEGHSSAFIVALARFINLSWNDADFLHIHHLDMRSFHALKTLGTGTEELSCVWIRSFALFVDLRFSDADVS